MPYRFIEGLTIADVAFEATGSTLDEVFESAGLALTAIMVSDVSSIKQNVEKRIALEFDDPEKLLFNFLDELIFLKDAELLLFSKFMINIEQLKDKYILTATLYGDKLDSTRQEHLTDVKAVTMHHFKVEKTKTGWYCRVILDI